MEIISARRMNEYEKNIDKRIYLRRENESRGRSARMKYSLTLLQHNLFNAPVCPSDLWSNQYIKTFLESDSS